MIDYNDSQAIWKFGCETTALAEQVNTARGEYAESIKTLKIALVQAYEEELVKDTVSEEKAYLLLVAEKGDLQPILEKMITSRQNYKGLQKILEARLALQNLYQSIIKNQVKES